MADEHVAFHRYSHSQPGRNTGGKVEHKMSVRVEIAKSFIPQDGISGVEQHSEEVESVIQKLDEVTYSQGAQVDVGGGVLTRTTQQRYDEDVTHDSRQADDGVTYQTCAYLSYLIKPLKRHRLGH